MTYLLWKRRMSSLRQILRLMTSIVIILGVFSDVSAHRLQNFPSDFPSPPTGLAADVLASVMASSGSLNGDSDQDSVVPPTDHQIPSPPTSSSGTNLIDMLTVPSRDNSLIQRKLLLLQDVHSSVSQLFD